MPYNKKHKLSLTTTLLKGMKITKTTTSANDNKL